MAVPTYNELLARCDMKNSTMKETFDDKHIRQFSLTLDIWEKLARFLGMPSSDIADIKKKGDIEEQKIIMLECWKQRCGSMATYEVMVEALLQISRTDLAEKVITLRQSLKDTHTLETNSTNQSLHSSGIEYASSLAAMSTLSLPAIPSQHTAQVTQTLTELEDEFFELVRFVESTLKTSSIQIDTITRRFSMLPQSIRRQHETDECYKETRRRILNSETVKKLFDNLTELKHWNYMIPDTLDHILKDVKIDEIHKKIDEYKEKLLIFKANTELKELIGISFPVPDYCIELTMVVEGWEDNTIQEVEYRAVNIVRQAAYSSPHISLGWKGVNPGSINLTFILMESVKFIPQKLLEDNGVVSVQVDGGRHHSKESIKVNSTSKNIMSLLILAYNNRLLQITIRYQVEYGIERQHMDTKHVEEEMF